MTRKTSSEATPRREARVVSTSFDYSLDFKKIDFRQQPELYRIGRGEQGVLFIFTGEINLTRNNGTQIASIEQLGKGITARINIICHLKKLIDQMLNLSIIFTNILNQLNGFIFFGSI